jgi:AcrR family transcriptional regulator
VDNVNMSSPDPARRYHHGHLRDALVDAGLELARAGGPGAVVLRAATRSAGVSHNAAYRHFEDRDALLGAVSQRCMAQLALLMEARMAGVGDGEPPAVAAWSRLGAIGRAYVEFATTEPGWFRTAFGEVHGPPADPAEGVGASGLGPFELLGARLDELVAVGEISAERRPGLEYAAWAGVHGLSSLLIDGPLQQLAGAEREHALDVVLTAIERGLSERQDR